MRCLVALDWTGLLQPQCRKESVCQYFVDIFRDNVVETNKQQLKTQRNFENIHALVLLLFLQHSGLAFIRGNVLNTR